MRAVLKTPFSKLDRGGCGPCEIWTMLRVKEEEGQMVARQFGQDTRQIDGNTCNACLIRRSNVELNSGDAVEPCLFEWQNVRASTKE